MLKFFCVFCGVEVFFFFFSGSKLFFVVVRAFESGLGIGTLGLDIRTFLKRDFWGWLSLTHEGEPLTQNPSFPLIAMYHCLDGNQDKKCASTKFVLNKILAR